MGKDLNVTVLMDFYGQLLTQKQYAAMDMYYNQDLSLAEIAEEAEISRQGVRDFIKRGEKQLFELEEKLGLAKRFSDMSARIKEINEITDKETLGAEDLKRLKTLAAELTEYL